MNLTFSYKQVGKKVLPIIPVKIRHNNKIIETEAYVDSGASISAFHTIFAELAGINFTQGEIVYPKGTAGHIKAYLVETTILIGEQEIACKVFFSNELGCKFNLLGMQGVFDKFKITFDNKRKKVIFEQH